MAAAEEFSQSFRAGHNVGEISQREPLHIWRRSTGEREKESDLQERRVS